MAGREPLKMSIDLSVLNHLGLNLYSNVAAVLSEAVANAWDADASEVRIVLDSAKDTIEITDNGSGMAYPEINAKYLAVGYSKRLAEGDITPGGRAIMGRKGIGKLSLFSIADQVTLHTTGGGETTGFRMTSQGIQKAIASGKDYLPAVVDAREHAGKKGTHIVLNSLKKHRLSQSATALKKRLARRFSVIGTEKFRAYINTDEVTVYDRDDLRLLQFLWEIGKAGQYGKAECPSLERRDYFDGLAAPEKGWVIEGWVGAVAKPKQLESKDGGNLNSIVVLSRGRLIQENILDRMNDGRIYTKYLTGQIQADFLDISSKDDIATSDRQRIVEDDERYQVLEAYVRKCLNSIANQWTDWRNELGADEAQRENPVLTDWLSTLSEGAKRHAKKLLGQIQALPIDREEDRKLLFRHGILAFERLSLRQDIDKLPEAIERGAEKLLELFAQVDDIEATLYHDIAKGRIEVIRAFKGLVDANEKEKVLQKYLFEHLWLLDASWERAAGSEVIESRLQKEFERIDTGLSKEEREGRVDIKYRTTAGKHIIIELKRADRVMDPADLQKQGRKYKNALEKILKAVGRDREPVELIFVVGMPVVDGDNVEYVEKTLGAINGRVIQYDQLIERAIQAYNEYIVASEKVNRIEAITSRL